MKKLLASLCLISFIFCAVSPAFAEGKKFEKGGITGKSVAAAALLLVVWPGIGQAVNEEKGNKVVTHAVVGLLPPFRFWSCYDALVDRKGGYWEGRI